MIDSGIYTKSSLKMSIQQIRFEDFTQQEVTVQKSIMFHLINSYMLSVFTNKEYEELQKIQIVQEYGELLGFNLAQEECIGFVKYTKSQKNDNKQFVGEMKLLNSRIWTIVVGSKGKLFAVSADTTLVNSYRIQDREFKLGKSASGEGQKQYTKLLLNFCHGLITGVLNKFLISGQIICAENLENGGVYLELKNLVKKDDQVNPLQKMKSNIF